MSLTIRFYRRDQYMTLCEAQQSGGLHRMEDIPDSGKDSFRTGLVDTIATGMIHMADCMDGGFDLEFFLWDDDMNLLLDHMSVSGRPGFEWSKP